MPIATFKDPVTGLDADLSASTPVATYNTRLLHAYANLDQRLPQVVYAVKAWYEGMLHGVLPPPCSNATWVNAPQGQGAANEQPFQLHAVLLRLCPHGHRTAAEPANSHPPKPAGIVGLHT